MQKENRRIKLVRFDVVGFCFPYLLFGLFVYSWYTGILKVKWAIFVQLKKIWLWSWKKKKNSKNLLKFVEKKCKNNCSWFLLIFFFDIPKEYCSFFLIWQKASSNYYYKSSIKIIYGFKIVPIIAIEPNFSFAFTTMFESNFLFLLPKKKMYPMQAFFFTQLGLYWRYWYLYSSSHRMSMFYLQLFIQYSTKTVRIIKRRQYK